MLCQFSAENWPFFLKPNVMIIFVRQNSRNLIHKRHFFHRIFWRKYFQSHNIDPWQAIHFLLTCRNSKLCTNECGCNVVGAVAPTVVARHRHDIANCTNHNLSQFRKSASTGIRPSTLNWHPVIQKDGDTFSMSTSRTQSYDLELQRQRCIFKQKDFLLLWKKRSSLQQRRLERFSQGKRDFYYVKNALCYYSRRTFLPRWRCNSWL
jgi:hypothetical protein